MSHFSPETRISRPVTLNIKGLILYLIVSDFITNRSWKKNESENCFKVVIGHDAIDSRYFISYLGWCFSITLNDFLSDMTESDAICGWFFTAE